MNKLTAEEQHILHDFSERLASSEKAIESFRASAEQQPSHLKILPTYMLSEMKSFETSFERAVPSVHESVAVSRLLVPTIKELSPSTFNVSLKGTSEGKKPSRPLSMHKRRISSRRSLASEQRPRSRESRTSVKRTPSKRISKRVVSTASAKQRSTTSSAKKAQVRFDNIPNLHFEVRKLTSILEEHMKKCPALLQDIKRKGGSRLLV
jgi:hypothetical protein